MKKYELNQSYENQSKIYEKEYTDELQLVLVC